MTTASTSRGPYRTGVRRREQIIGAATAVFAEYGYAGGSVRTIADRIGVSQDRHTRNRDHGCVHVTPQPQTRSSETFAMR